jgi:hypothetical protein
MANPSPPPGIPLHQTMAQIGNGLSTNIQRLRDHLQRSFEDLGRQTSGAVRGIHHHLHQAQQRFQHTVDSAQPLFAVSVQPALGIHPGPSLFSLMECTCMRMRPSPSSTSHAPSPHRTQSLASRPTAAAGPPAPHRQPADPLADLALSPEDIKFRMEGVPVYAVVNSNNEFVLVSGEDDGRQLGLIFFSQEDAQALVSTVRHARADLG